jgi:beta-lactamase superfamily II metal-dependent hydrolase
MRRAIRAAAATLAAVAMGCGTHEAEVPTATPAEGVAPKAGVTRLTRGTVVTIAPTPGQSELTQLLDVGEARSVEVAVGTKAEVITDEDHAEEMVVRPVVIRITDGPHSGKTGRIPWMYLRAD